MDEHSMAIMAESSARGRLERPLPGILNGRESPKNPNFRLACAGRRPKITFFGKTSYVALQKQDNNRGC